MSELSGVSREYIGIANARTVGRRSFPLGVELKGRNEGIKAEQMSNQLEEGPERLLFLSVKSQATLGLTKDMRAGICYVEDYDGEIQYYEVVGSNLRAICISDLYIPEARLEAKTDVPSQRLLIDDTPPDPYQPG